MIYSCIYFPFFLILPACGLFKAHARKREANEPASLGSGFEQAPHQHPDTRFVLKWVPCAPVEQGVCSGGEPV